MRQAMAVAVVLSAVLLAGCTHHTVTVEPIEVKPIQITVDVVVKVDKDLDEFFDYQDEDGGNAAGAGKGGQP